MHASLVLELHSTTHSGQVKGEDGQSCLCKWSLTLELADDAAAGAGQPDIRRAKKAMNRWTKRREQTNCPWSYLVSLCVVCVCVCVCVSHPSYLPNTLLLCPSAASFSGCIQLPYISQTDCLTGSTYILNGLLLFSAGVLYGFMWW